MSKLLNLSSNPHIRDNVTTAEIMRDVFIALIPTTLYGIIQWGFNAALVCILTVAAAVISELVYEKCMKLPITIKDWSAAVTGLILALNCPPNIPAWIPCLGAAFLGRIPGTIGEVSKLCVLIGAAYLIIRKVISPKIPLIYIGTVAVFTLLFGGHGFDLYYLACELCAGGLIFGAFFMATDYVTSPITPLGQIIFAIMLGILTGLFRLFGGSAEGVSYAIIICNILVPMINVHTVPKAFGKEGAKK